MTTRPDPYLRVTPGYTMRVMFPTQKGVCACGCGKKLSGRRTRWASNECAHQAMRLYDIRCGRADAVRKALMQRDAGMCSGCGVICELQYEQPGEIRKWLRQGVWGLCALPRAGTLGRGMRYVTVVPWEAHHVVPVSEGGGGCDLDGYVILCRACHGKETGKLRKRLNGTPVQTSLFPEGE